MPRAHPGQRHRCGGREQHAALDGQGALRLHLLLRGLPLRVITQGHFLVGILNLMYRVTHQVGENLPLILI